MSDERGGTVRGLRVRDLMRTEVVSVRADTTVRELVKLLAEHRIGGVPVLGERDELVGIITTTDLIRLAADAAQVPLDDLLSHLTPDSEPGTDALLSFLESDAWGDDESLAPLGKSAAEGGDVEYEEYHVCDLMRSVKYSVQPETSIEELARVMLEGRVHRAPVVDQGRLVGIVTTYDVLRVVASADVPREG